MNSVKNISEGMQEFKKLFKVKNRLNQEIAMKKSLNKDPSDIEYYDSLVLDRYFGDKDFKKMLL